MTHKKMHSTKYSQTVLRSTVVSFNNSGQDGVSTDNVSWVELMSFQVTINEKEGSVTVENNGKGLPVEAGIKKNRFTDGSFCSQWSQLSILLLLDMFFHVHSRKCTSINVCSSCPCSIVVDLPLSGTQRTSHVCSGACLVLKLFAFDNFAFLASTLVSPFDYASIFKSFVMERYLAICWQVTTTTIQRKRPKLFTIPCEKHRFGPWEVTGGRNGYGAKLTNIFSKRSSAWSSLAKRRCMTLLCPVHLRWGLKLNVAILKERRNTTRFGRHINEVISAADTLNFLICCGTLFTICRAICRPSRNPRSPPTLEKASQSACHSKWRKPKLIVQVYSWCLNQFCWSSMYQDHILAGLNSLWNEEAGQGLSQRALKHEQSWPGLKPIVNYMKSCSVKYTRTSWGSCQDGWHLSQSSS